MSARASVPAALSAEPRAKTPRKRGRLRRFLRALLIVALVLFLVRLAVVLSLPVLIDRWAKPRGLACSYEKLNLALLRGRVELWHLSLAARTEGDTARAQPMHPGAEPLVHLEYATLDVDVPALCRFDLALERVELDGLDVTLEREADGQFRLVRLLGLAPPPAPDAAGAADATGTSAASEPLELTLPISVAALRVQRVHVHYEDAHVEPPIDTRVDVNLSASDVGSESRPARLQLSAFSLDDLGSLFVEGRVTGDALARHGELRAEVVVRRPEVLRGCLAELGIAPAARQISFQMRAEVDVAVQGERKDEVRASLALRDVRLSADLEEAFGLDRLTCRADSISARRAHVAEVAVVGLRGSASRLSNRAVRIAGLDFLPSEPAVPDAAQSAPIAAGATGAASVPAGFGWQFDRIVLESGRLRFDDAAVEPAAELELELDRLEIGRLDTQATDAAQPVTVHALVHAPGVAANAKIDGEIAFFSRHKKLDLDIGADHITLQAVAPYLRAADLESDLESGTLACKIVGSADEDAEGVTRGEVRIEGFRLGDAEEAVGIDRIALRDVVIDPSRSLVRLGSVEIAGMRCGYERDANLVTRFLGLRWLPHAPDSSAPTAPEPAVAASSSASTSTVAPANDKPAPQADRSGTSASPPAKSSRFELESLVWHDAALRFADFALKPALVLDFTDAEIEVRDFTLGGEASDAAPATVRMKLTAPGMVDEFALDATVTSRPGPLDLSLDVHIRGRGIRAGEIAPYLLAQGIDSKLDGASVALNLKASLKSEQGGVGADLSLADVALENAGQRSISLGALSLRDAHFDDDTIRVGEIVIERPFAALSRDEHGAFVAGGLRFVPRAPPRPDEKPPPSLFAPLLRPLLEQLKAFVADKNIVIGRARLSGTEVAWSDAGVSPPVAVRATLGAKLDGFVMGETAAPGSFAVELAVPGALEKLELTGTLSLAPDDWRGDVRLESHGLEGGPLAPYLPPELAADLHGGRLQFHLAAAAKAVPEGGMSAELALDELVYDAGDAAEAPFKLGALVLRVARADLEQRVLAIDELSLRGVELGARRGADGSLHVLGLALGSQPARPPAASAPPLETTAATPVAAADAPAIASAPEAPLASSGSQPVAPAQPAAAATIHLSKLDLGLEKLTFIDETRGEGAVPIVASLRITNTSPTVLLDPDPAALVPVHLDVHAAIEPLVKSIDVALDAQPFADEPTLDVTFAARGVRGAGLTEVAPELAARIDGSGLTDGELTAELQLSLLMDRRTPTSFDFRRGFGASLVVENLAFRDAPGGTVLAGLDAVDVEIDRIVPSSGDVHIASLDVIKPRGVFIEQADGLHALGLVLKPVPAAAAAAGGAEVAPAAGEVDEPANDAAAGSGTSDAAPLTTPVAQSPAAEVRIDQLAISGIDVLLRDDSTTPPVVMPLAELEIYVDRFTTRAFTERIPVRFTAFLSAGDVELPLRARAGGLTGAVDEVPGVSTVSGFVRDARGREVALQSRPAFEEVYAKGVIALHPTLSGTVTTELRALELMNFAGAARDAGFTLHDGLLDARVKLEVDPAKGADFDARLRFSELSVTEPIGGPIQRYLLLPAPLDQMLFVLRDKNGDQVIPLSFFVEGTSVSKDEITKAAIVAFSSVTAKAIASSPLRVLAWIGSWFGIGTSESEKLEKMARTIRLDPGDAALSSDAVRELEPLIELLKDDSDTMIVVHQELGEGDLARAEVLANPSAEDALAIAERLRQERAELGRQCDELVRRARALSAVDREDEALLAGDRLRAIAQRTGKIEESLDRTLDLLRPGAERYRDRRTHAAGRVIAAQRIENLRELFAWRGVSDLATRMEVRSLSPEATAGAGGGRLTLTPRLRSVQ